MSCNCHEMNRRELFEYINQISFAVDDVKLFLDTHPENQKALDYFQKYKEKRMEALKEYAEVYGPLTVDTVSENSDCWNWINELAKIIISQFGGPDGELAASMRYLSQRYTMPYKEVTGILTDIGTEELAHMEMICAIIYQLTKNLSPEEIERSGFAPYYVDHTLAL